MASTPALPTSKSDRPELKGGLNLDLDFMWLPATCGFFLIVLVIIIAFFLIKKKGSHSPRKASCPEKSGNTIESFHEHSDASIYDVINEIQGNGGLTRMTESENSQRQRHFPTSKNRGFYSLASCLGIGEKSSCKKVILTTARTDALSRPNQSPSPCPCMTKAGDQISELVCHSLEAESANICLQFEGRVYETLDRRCRTKTSTLENAEDHNSVCISSDPVAKEHNIVQIANMTAVDCPSAMIGHGLPNCIVQPFKETMCKDNNVKLETLEKPNDVSLMSNDFTEIKQSCKKLHPSISSQDQTTICKLSFLPVKDGSPDSKSCQAQTFYYVIQSGNDDDTDIERHQPCDDYDSFQSPSGLCLQFPSTSLNNDHNILHNEGKMHSLNLKPLTNTSLIQQFENKSSQKISTEIGKLQVNPNISEASKGSKATKYLPRKKRLLKKSESFSESRDRPNESVRKLSLGAISFKQHAASSDQSSEKMDKEEIARILSKLGPLPPIPFPIKSDANSSQPSFIAREDEVSTCSDKVVNRGKGSNSKIGVEPREISGSVYCISGGREGERDLNVSLVQNVSREIVTCTRENDCNDLSTASASSARVGDSFLATERVDTTSASAVSHSHYFILEPTETDPSVCSSPDCENDGD